MSRSKEAGCWKRLRKLLVPGKTGVGCSPVVSDSYGIAKPTLSATEWMQCFFPGVTAESCYPPWGQTMTLCDHRTAEGRPFSLGYITDFRLFNAKHHNASSTNIQELAPALC